MDIPLLIHSNPKDIQDSSTIQLQKGQYMVVSDKIDSLIRLFTGEQAFDSVHNGFRFIIHKTEKVKVSINKVGSESSISLSVRKLE